MTGKHVCEWAAATLAENARKIDVCLAKLSNEQVWERGSAEENAIGNLVLHLCGNAKQYFVSGVGGAADTRERDGEFNATGGVDVEVLRSLLARTMAEVAGVLASVAEERLMDAIRVQNREITTIHAILKSTEHFGMHTGQIIAATKRLTQQSTGFHSHNRRPA
ncbi:MAG: DUF1572 domain-containing protein [Acidobacteria bacterium]|nr:DUF1572 domain-containing protein [Acidobacteriota bacterium]